jgi:DNA repair exonuclease SbcCD ATPase subunit
MEECNNCQSLSSRLKEAEKMIKKYEEQRVSFRHYEIQIEKLEKELAKYQTDPASYVEAVKCLCGSVDSFIKYHHNPIVKQKNEEIQSLSQRLSQAEAENRDLRLHPYVVLDSAVVEKNVLDLQARLSNLMDVAEKLKTALEGIMPRPECVSIPPSCAYITAKKAIAEWDGIKKEGV